MTILHVVLPKGVDDPMRPSGGNRYDRRLCDGLVGLGWDVREHEVQGPWPHADPAGLARLADVLAAVPSGGLVLLDGLLASAAVAVLVPQASRLRLAALVHMPRPDGIPTAADEVAALRATRAVITTSDWTRRRLEDEGVPADRLHLALPGVDPAATAPGSATGSRLLAVGAVTPDKGQDLLLDALHRIAGLDWTCTLAGPVDRTPGFVDDVRTRAAALAGRVRLAGPLGRAALADVYHGADVLVLPSRTESFGLVVLEALAAGLPVLGFRVGGVPEALALGGREDSGLLVEPASAAALAGALTAWLTDGGLRARLRAAAAAARTALPGWSGTARRVAAVLATVPR
jgi:glycosyltransferase involved in cell wall biosynthesis